MKCVQERKKPYLGHIKPFGCTSYMTIPAERRQKLDDKARKLIFVGYPDGTKVYRLLNKDIDRVYISKDVTFIEGDPYIKKFKTETEQNQKIQNLIKNKFRH